MPRLERAVNLSVDPVDGAHLTGAGGRFQQGLHVIVRGDTVTAWIPAGSATAPPKLTGRIDRHSDRMSVTGIIREARFEQFNALFWAALAALTLAIAAGGTVAAARNTHVWLFAALFGVMSVLFAALSVSNHKGRFRLFDTQARDLDFSLSQWAHPRS